MCFTHQVAAIAIASSLIFKSLSCSEEPYTPTAAEIEGAALLEAHIANLEAVQSYDVIITSSDLIESSGLELIEIIVAERIVHSVDPPFDLYVRRAEKIPLNSGSDEPSKPQIAYRYGLMAEGKLHMRSFPENLRTAKVGVGIRFEDVLATPVIEMIGLARFPTPGSIPADILKGTITDLRTPQKRHTMQNDIDGDCTVVFQDSKNSDLAWHCRRRYQIDIENLVVSSLRYSHRRKGSKEWIPDVAEEIFWGKAGAIRLPKSCVGEAIVNKKDPKGEFGKETHSYDYRFTWLSVNEKIRTNELGLKNLWSTRQLDTIVDEETHTSILENL